MAGVGRAEPTPAGWYIPVAGWYGPSMTTNAWPAYDRYLGEYATYSQKLNGVLYDMCTGMPGHTDKRELWAKVWIIGRAYATGIERHQKKNDRLGSTIATLEGAASWLDEGLNALREKGQVPAVEHLPELANLHGMLLKALSVHMRESHRPRSFVSKYLHFHAPIFPIYDSVANRQLRKWYRWNRTWAKEYPLPAEADLEYWRYCVRLSRMVQDWTELSMVPTARNLDTYLLWSAYDPAPKD